MKRTETTDNWDVLGGRISFHENDGMYEIRYSVGIHTRFYMSRNRRRAMRFYLKMVKSVLNGESVDSRLNMF